ncbi:MAG TPA: MerR family transcriptional regulator [Chitinophagaceae bacterium]|nr:MerR family transcriptional regulator [Chitinophagaceae bacterium]
MQQLDLFSNTEQSMPEEKKSFVQVAPPAKKKTSLQAVAVEEKEVEMDVKNNGSDGVKRLVRADNITGKRGRLAYTEMDKEFVYVEIPADEALYKKQYYPIREVAQWFHVNTSLLRYWSNEFDILQPRTTRKGDRLFRPEDIKNLQLIYHLLRQRKYSIEGAKKFLSENKGKADKEMQILHSLTKIRAFLLELRANLGA